MSIKKKRKDQSTLKSMTDSWFIFLKSAHEAEAGVSLQECGRSKLQAVASKAPDPSEVFV